MNKMLGPGELEPISDGPLYAARKKIYPQSVSGPFRRLKWRLMLVCLGIYYILPFIRWNRGAGAPDQAVLIDFPNRRFYFFFIELWPQEIYYFTGLLIIAAMALFLMNALGGRIWCGYLCPQTVWTDLFYAVERLVEGDRRERMKKDAADFTMRRLFEVLAKHSIWLLIAWWTGGAWVLYFSDAPTLVKDLLRFQAPTIAYTWIAILTFTTYVLAGFLREQVCVYMCPWPRIQAALTDEWALNVTYKPDRGERRTSLKKATELRAIGLPAGDCIDCQQCVAVCPTGIDIRNGPQLECIQCGLCIDACDNVMAKIGRPARLIGYDNDINIQRRTSGKSEIFRPVRPRTIIYAAMIVLVAAIMLYSLATRRSLELNVLHDRNPTSVRLTDGSIRNAYTIRLLNKRSTEQTVSIGVVGVPEVKLQLVGIESGTSEQPMVVIGRDRTLEVRALVTAPSSSLGEHSVPLTFKATDVASGETAVAIDTFVAP